MGVAKSRKRSQAEMHALSQTHFDNPLYRSEEERIEMDRGGDISSWTKNSNVYSRYETSNLVDNTSDDFTKSLFGTMNAEDDDLILT
jgi:hypothetical protein